MLKYPFPYTVIFRQDQENFVALCLELNVASQGETLKEAQENINDAITEYLDYMREINAEGEIEPVPFHVLRNFLLDGLGETQHAQMEVATVAG